MDFDSQKTIFFAIFALFIAGFVFKVFRNGGIRGALFGARIEKTVGKVAAASGKLFKSTLKVHVMRGDRDQKLVGIELVQKSIASYQMLPITLSVEDSRELIALLQAAVESDPM